MMKQLKRLSCYIDGFNLYRGMMSKGMRRFLWLDLYALARSLCPTGAQVVSVKYFTARILNLHSDPSSPEYAKAERSRKRQSEFIEAIKSRGVEVFEGKFKKRRVRCRGCGAEWIKPEEKMTDVQIATQVLSDAFEDRFDVAIVASGDADLVPPIRVVVEHLRREVVVAFPPHRTLNELKSTASGFIHINKRHLARCLLPDEVEHDGHTLKRPLEWT